jgi:hypothetical protein
MLKRLFQNDELTDLSVLSVDTAMPDSRQPEATITRNKRNNAIIDDPNEIYKRARQIYFRAKRVRHSRSVSIL